MSLSTCFIDDNEREAAVWVFFFLVHAIRREENVDFLFLFLLSPPAGDPKTWQNKSLPGDPNYLVGANCVSVLIDHF